ncbi:PrpR N-terminal domain-containing protein [[Brevibacterium] frigoritolerans]|uniref:PrpR N-terminal domain-containing protein n=1 Tax=Peribacillus frigoritolerans TaxID=450367 RepID=A0A941J7R1_9BACI|nr:PrpR N-terminal domain-containing protein [Peribacillus frigoritolerans]
MTRILVISPYAALKDLFNEVNIDLKKDIHIEIGDLCKGVAVAKELQEQNFDIIISRGATAPSSEALPYTCNRGENIWI